jgi:ethanolamine ammonia-lyase small subunit
MSHWDRLRKVTQARIGLDRAGHALSTRALLDLWESHAIARDSVITEWDLLPTEAALREAGVSFQALETAVGRARDLYLLRPDLGRKLSVAAHEAMAHWKGRKPTIALVLSNGLSSLAAERHGFAMVERILRESASRGWTVSPVFLAPNGRVALGDEIGAEVEAQLTIMLIGERPGLSSADSLGIYLTHGPRVGLTDAFRNCISNVRPPDGLGYDAAVLKLMFLAEQALKRGLSGVALKDESNDLLP